MSNVFIQLAIVLGLSSLLGYFMYKLRLPLILAYLLVGVLIGTSGLLEVNPFSIFHFLPDIGIAFVLFMIGMELDLYEVRKLGKPIIITSLVQIIISAITGFTIAGVFHFDLIQSLYLGICLSFSSTLVVIKLLLDKKDLGSLYGKLSIGVLLVEDLVAMVVLMVLSLSSSSLNLGITNSWPLLSILVKAFALFSVSFILGKYLLPKVLSATARSLELLFLTSLTWCFLLTTFALFCGFSVVIGAFLAGIAIAQSPFHLQIQARIKPLRDFFVALFFVYLGSSASLKGLAQAWPVVLAFTLYALLAKPFISIVVLGMFGFRKHTLFKTALNLSQISEFSLVILLVGIAAGVIQPVSLSIMASVAVVSIVISSLMISFSSKIYPFVAPLIGFFEHKSKTHFLEVKEKSQLQDHVIVIGGHGFGGPIVNFLKKENIPFLVVDFNPHIVESLREQGVKVIYGDISDPEILANLGLEEAKLIISSATELSDNEALLAEVKRRHIEAKVLIRAKDVDHGELLKKLGADFVISPERLSAHFLVNQLRENWPQVHFGHF